MSIRSAARCVGRVFPLHVRDTTPIDTISRLNQPFYLAATADNGRTDNAARRWLWKRVSPRVRNFFFPRLSRIVDPSGLGRYPNVVFEIRSFDLFPRAFPRARSRLLGEKRAISPRPAEMHCPFENRTGGGAAIHRRRPGNGYRRRVSTAKESTEQRVHARSREGRRSVSSCCVAACCERWNVDGLTNCPLIRVFAKINHSAVSVSPLHSTARRNCRILRRNCDRALHHQHETWR